MSPPSVSPPVAMKPRLVGDKYELAALIGKGGMGTVHRAVDLTTGREVAVKLMATAFAQSAGDSDDSNRSAEVQQLVARFEREARLAGSIDTRHIVRVHDAGTDKETRTPYMVMELLTGEDVSAYARRTGPLRPDLALRVVAQACEGLARAHEAGVVHRDVKPSNLFLARDEEGGVLIKLLDFGIAKATDDSRLDADGGDSRTLTTTGAMLGSPHYMSPEQAIGARDIDGRTDLWSLGVVLFKLLTGRTPFDERDTVGQLIVSIVSRRVPSVQDFAPWVPPAVAEVAYRALKAERQERYPTAQAMLDAIAPLLPDGHEIRPEMLAPMTDDERGHVTQRRSLAAPDPSAPSQGTTSATVVALGSEESTRIVTPGATSLPPRSRRSPAAVIGGAVSAVALLLVLALVSRRPVTALAGAPSPPPAPTAAPDEPAATAGALRPAAPKAVSLAVSPADAIVDVDGARVAVVAGAVTIAGEPGSVHEVRVSAGGKESVVEVILTAQGPRPERVSLDLSARAPAAPRAQAAPSTPVAPRGQAAANPQKPPASPAPTAKIRPEFEQKFE